MQPKICFWKTDSNKKTQIKKTKQHAPHTCYPMRKDYIVKLHKDHNIYMFGINKSYLLHN